MVDRSSFKEFCLILGVSGSLACFAANAEKKPAHIGSCSAAPEMAQHLLKPDGTGVAPGKTNITADKSTGTRDKMTLQGNVVVRSSTEKLTADTLIYDKKANKLTASGNVIMSNNDVVIMSESGYKQINGDQAKLDNATYFFPARNARGNAKTIKVESKTKVKLKKSTYSTCSKKSNFWQLKTSYLKIDNNKGRGLARNVVLKIKKVPVLYIPVMTFPTDNRRKTGFLMPSIGASDNSGSDIRIPFYWNIAPNRDATITSRFLGKRGYQLITEYRYKHKHSSGIMGFEYLPDDDAFGDDRNLFYYRQFARLGRYWSTNVNLNSVSDPTYLSDLGSSLRQTSVTQLERRIDLTYTRSQWAVRTRFQNYQPLFGIQESYQRLPQILLNGIFHSQKNPKVFYHTYAEVVNFAHDDNTKITGSRFDFWPGISYRLLSAPGYYVTPKISYRYTAYQLDNQPLGADSAPDRSIPIFSLDAGLFFDRNFKFRSHAYLQTLEPRIYYLYVPNENQDDIPVFDTSKLDFSIYQLFRENRFSGADRHGDANQLTVALTSRFINEDSGLEKFTATIGQILYFQDREVALPGQASELSNNSDAVARLVWRPTKFQKVIAANQWDIDRNESKLSIIAYQYRSDRRHLLNVAYRFREDTIDQTDLSYVWGLSAKWNMIGRWNYSIKDQTTLEGLAGIEYNNCCWAIRLLGRTYIRDINAEKDNSIHLQLVLKGLSKVGDNIDTLFKQSIIGYQDTLR